MSKMWKKAKSKVDAVNAFDSVDRGGYQGRDERYHTGGRVQPPDDDPPGYAQQTTMQNGENAAYYTGHPQSGVSSPFVAYAAQSPQPSQYSPQTSPSQQPLQYSPQSPTPLDYSPQSPPSQYPSQTASYSVQSTHHAQQNAGLGFYAPAQGSSTSNYTSQVSQAPMSQQSVSGQNVQGQARVYENSSGNRTWGGPAPSYGSYQPQEPHYSQRSSTMYHGDHQRPYDPVRSSTMPNYYVHSCAENYSQQYGRCLVCHPLYPD